ncbi:MAG TPA: helix-turn-helix domain-containing protein, partial [Thermoanaerobaculia bacterium]|nr:helix-turn-helix domain-containing protein [Thermoanaerobaculia bacterium]
MLGETVKATRIRKGLTQAKLARLANVSRRHLAALEKGANISVLVLRKVASVLDLSEIDLGGVRLVGANRNSGNVNIAVLADTIREAQSGTLETEALLTKAQDLLTGGETAVPQPARGGAGKPVVRFPTTLVQRIPPQGATARVAEDGGDVEIPIAADIRQGEPADETVKGQLVVVPAASVGKGEMLFRARGDDLAPWQIEDGDILVVELRRGGKATTGELVIGTSGDRLYIGRWFQKQGKRAIVSDGLAEVASH